MASTLNASTTLGLISSADTSGVLQLQTASTAAVTINASQNVGIGTASPSTKLDVNGNLNVSSAGNIFTASTSGIFFNGNGSYATGIYNNGSGNLLFAANGALRATIDPSGNLGLGVTPSAWYTPYRAFDIGTNTADANISGGIVTRILSNAYLNNSIAWIYKYSLAASHYQQYQGAHTWWNAPAGTAGNAITFTQAMTLDASGRLIVGGTTYYGKITSVGGTFALVTNTASERRLSFWSTSNGDSENAYIQVQNDGATTNTGEILFATKNSGGTLAERARIDASGNLLVGATAVVSGERLYVTGSNANFINRVYNSNANPSGAYYYYTSAAPNGTGNYFIECDDTGGIRFGVRSNGGIANYSANNANLSDRREKTNFAPAKSYLGVICAIPVQTFNYIDQNMEEDGGLTLGVVAQDVQAVAPELVMESNWGTEEEPKMRLSIYQTDLQYAMMKCIQEQQAIIETLKARLDAANL